ncbi:hypothetical protein ID866_4318 [Astraeus odoratus]|nr:hypothetical protein ID866_4318 [Astraeus odoratus]
MIPTIEEVEQYFENVERIVAESLTVASFDLPNIREAINRLWVDISRYGPPGIPPLPEIHVGGLGAFEVPPPPPPPPPPPKSLVEKAGDWLKDHPWMVSGVVLSTLGVGLLAGHHVMSNRHAFRRRVKASATTPERRQVVVVLGGDHPLGLPLILELEKKGYIVITSVSSAETIAAIESMGHGYVRALVLDPNEPGTIPIFLRSLASTLSRRFPISAAGDPYVPSPYHPLLLSIVSLLAMPTSSLHCTPAPLEQISLRGTYLPHILSTHIAPLQTLQALLPLLRADAQRTRSRKSIIVCLPAADALVGLPFNGVSAMSAAATLGALNVLRRELLSVQGMGTIRVVTVDVGSVGLSVGRHPNPPAMEDWTPSEKLAYGPAFSALSETVGARTPEDVSGFVDNLVGVISEGTKTTGAGKSVYGIRVGLAYEKIKDWVRGNRFSTGAGAGTYMIASLLPVRLLDTLLTLPQVLVGIRNGLLPVPPRRFVGVEKVAPMETTQRTDSSIIGTSPKPSAINEPAEPAPSPASPDEGYQTGSEGDAESNGGDISTEISSVESSWISLGPSESST